MPELKQQRRLAIWNRLTPEQRDYDRFVARQVPFGLTATERFHAETPGGRAAKEAMFDTGNTERGCSCHMSAPCSWCESLIECEECGEWVPGEDEMAVHLDAKHPLVAEQIAALDRAN